MKNLIVSGIGASLNLLSHFSKRYAARLALKIFMSPRKGKIDNAQLSFLHSANRKQVYHDGIPVMTYQWKGRNKTILLAHGWESNSYRWKALITLLQKHDHNIICLDAPAHGDSGGRLFNAILYSEFIKTAAIAYNPDIIVGHSVGGMAAVFSQFKYQLQPVKKIVLLGAPDRFTDVLGRYGKLMGFNNIILDEMGHEVYDRFGNYPTYYASSNFCKDLDVDGLIIHDKEDDIIPYSDADAIAASLVKSKLLSTSGLGHSLRDQSVNTAILEFINS